MRIKAKFMLKIREIHAKWYGVMMKKIGYSSLTLAILASIGTANAAGLDRSGQDISAFLQDGNYAEAVYTYIDADVSGKDNAGNDTKDIAPSYDFFRYGVKTDVSDRVSVGVLYDEPFGASVNYTGNSDFVAPTIPADITPDLVYTKTLNSVTANLPADKQMLVNFLLADRLTAETIRDGLLEEVKKGNKLDKDNDSIFKLTQATLGLTDATLANQGQATKVDIRTQNATGLVGVKFGEKRNFQVYGGAAAQRLTGEVHLRGAAYQGATGYDARISPDTKMGWVAGVSYSKPEIALKAALTYRSEIEHESSISEVVPALGGVGATTRDFKVKIPESYNLDFQTGLSAKHHLLGTAKVRYVPWSDFDIRPPTYGDATASRNNNIPLPIVSYSKDQWTVELGLGKQINDKLSVAGNVGWDSGAGNPATSLGPVKGYYSVGGGVKYNVTPQVSVSLGGKYLKFGNATAQLPTGAKVGEFKDNDGFVAGIKLAYHAK